MPFPLDLREKNDAVDLPDSWLPLWRSYVRALRARNRSERTLRSYAAALRALAAAVAPAPTLERLTRQHLEQFVDGLQRGGAKPAYVAIHFRSLRAFFNWLVEEGELAASPMARMREPAVPDEPVPVLELEELRRLLKACEGQTFEDRRDLALIRFLIDTGVRLSGAAGMKLEDVDLDRQEAAITAKGGDVYLVDLGAKVVRDLDRYLRARQRHKARNLPAIWLGQRGALTADGVYQAVLRRALQAGLRPEKAVHVLRHSFSHHFRAAGGSGDDLQHLGGWKSPAMVAKYGRSLAQARAREAHRKYSPGDLV